MATTIGSLSFGTVATYLFTAPPGPCSITLTCLAGTAYAGLSGGTNVTAANGLPIPSAISAPFTQYAGDPALQVYALGAGSPTTLTWVISEETLAALHAQSGKALSLPEASEVTGAL